VSDGPVRLRDVLDGVGRRLGAGGAADTGVLWTAWTELVGDTMAAHVEPTSLRGGVLRVRADSPVWATETSYLAEEIRTRANGLLGSAKVREVKVWTGPGRVTPPQHHSAAHVGTGTTSQRDPSPDPETAFDRARRAWWRRFREAPRRGPQDEESPR
jgi:predicted nucleic acid-binding Zn ribbon protein